MRESVGADFPVSVKLNSNDFQRGGYTVDDAVEVARALEAERLDLLELSGGTYENPTMVMGPDRAAELAREAFSGVKPFYGTEPVRVAFHFKEEVITIERSGPFIMLITWPRAAFKSINANEGFIRRLERTLFEELY